MLNQGFLKIEGIGICFIDKTSISCIDGKPCDTNGDIIYTIEGIRIRERDFKQYRTFSPQFREHSIYEYIRRNDLSLTEVSCSCSKCGTIASDQIAWE